MDQERTIARRRRARLLLSERGRGMSVELLLDLNAALALVRAEL